MHLRGWLKLSSFGIDSDPGDFHAQPAGNAGKKTVCGVIRKRR